MRPTGTAIVLALIAVVVGAELLWDMAHGSAGTHWVLKLIILLCAVTGIAVLEARRRLG
jgi:uncharacterized membrane protein